MVSSEVEKPELKVARVVDTYGGFKLVHVGGINYAWVNQDGMILFEVWVTSFDKDPTVIEVEDVRVMSVYRNRERRIRYVVQELDKQDPEKAIVQIARKGFEQWMHKFQRG